MGRDDVPEGDACETPSERAAADDSAHLAGVDAGCGCVEVWEHLSEQRAGETDARSDAATAADD